MQASEVTSLLFGQLNFRGERQKVISSNIANMNTPNYKTKDLVFDNEIQKVSNKNDLSLKITNQNHISHEIDETKKVNPRLVKVPGLQEQNDGNNVNLDQQMSEMSKNTMIFDALQASIKKDSRLFKSVIESSQKN